MGRCSCNPPHPDNQLLKTLFTGYSIQVLGSNHDKQYWRSKPRGKWRRKLTRLLQKKRPVLYPFDIDQTYENILLIPPEKRKLVEQAGTN